MTLLMEREHLNDGAGVDVFPTCQLDAPSSSTLISVWSPFQVPWLSLDQLVRRIVQESRTDRGTPFPGQCDSQSDTTNDRGTGEEITVTK